MSAFDIPSGGRVWRFDTTKDEDDSTNIGGGLAVDQGTVYAVNGLGELVALDAAKGTMKWRSSFGAPARSAPTVVEGRIFLITIEDRLIALTTENGRQLWDHQATNPMTSMLGTAGAGLYRRARGGRLRLRRTDSDAGGKRHRGVDRQPGRQCRGRRHRRLLRDPRPAGDRRRTGATRSAWAV